MLTTMARTKVGRERRTWAKRAIAGTNKGYALQNPVILMLYDDTSCPFKPRETHIRMPPP